ncbi:MAG TPA: MMPL family transporter, partial [Methanocella sp.]|nr:MMPL family transporter [Methanocella sp.]
IDSRTGFELIEKEFGTGNLARITVLVTLPYDIRDAAGNMTQQALGQTERVSQLVAAIPDVGKVQSATRPYGDTIDYADMSGYSAVDQAIYQANIKDAIGKDGRTTALTVSFAGSPYSVEASRTIDRIRSDLKAYSNGEGKGVETLVGGSPAGTKDFQDLCYSGFAGAVPIVLFGIFLVLMIGLRSIFTPIRLIITLLMSIGWTLAIYIILFQNYLGEPSPWTLPIILFCTLMGLGIDYDIFLVSRIHEEVLNGKPDEEAIEHAVETTGSIITLCGFIMAATFGSMMLTSQIQMIEMGFVLCLAVILDATLMRLVLVPAIMVLMKKYNWWMPSLNLLNRKPKSGAGDKKEV